MDEVVGRRWWIVRPQLVDDPPSGDKPVLLREQDSEKRALARWPKVDGTPINQRVERAEDAVLPGHLRDANRVRLGLNEPGPAPSTGPGGQRQSAIEMWPLYDAQPVTGSSLKSSTPLAPAKPPVPPVIG